MSHIVSVAVSSKSSPHPGPLTVGDGPQRVGDQFSPHWETPPAADNPTLSPFMDLSDHSPPGLVPGSVLSGGQ